MACPTDCSSCDSSLSVAVTGFTGSCSGLNGTYTFVKNGCIWTGLPTVWGFLACDGDKWKLTVGPGSAGGEGEKDNEDGCPATGLYELTGIGSCVGQSPEASIS